MLFTQVIALVMYVLHLEAALCLFILRIMLQMYLVKTS